jgi:hypothetical protein
MKKIQNMTFLALAAGIVGQYRAAAPLGFDPQNAATVIAGYGTELAAQQPPIYAPLKPNQQGGRVRATFFTLTYATQGAGTSIALGIIPRGARILNGEFIASATFGGTTTISVGLAGKDGSGFIDAAGVTSDGVALLFAAVALTATTKQVLAATVALSYGLEVGRDCYITITNAVAAVGTQVVTGHLFYTVD